MPSLTISSAGESLGGSFMRAKPLNLDRRLLSGTDKAEGYGKIWRKASEIVDGCEEVEHTRANGV